ncbi:hypothetical protein D9M72_600550 [compost metagenome]
MLYELEAQAARQGYSRSYLTTGFRQPEAVGLYLANGYTALFDVDADLEVYKTLPFEKDITHLVTTLAFLGEVPPSHPQAASHA